MSKRFGRIFVICAIERFDVESVSRLYNLGKDGGTGNLLDFVFRSPLVECLRNFRCCSPAFVILLIILTIIVFDIMTKSFLYDASLVRQQYKLSCKSVQYMQLMMVRLRRPMALLPEAETIPVDFFFSLR